MGAKEIFKKAEKLRSQEKFGEACGAYQQARVEAEREKDF